MSNSCTNSQQLLNATRNVVNDEWIDKMLSTIGSIYFHILQLKITNPDTHYNDTIFITLLLNISKLYNY